MTEKISRLKVEVFRVFAERPGIRMSNRVVGICVAPLVASGELRSASRSGVAASTHELAGAGVVECARVSPAYLFRLAATPDPGYLGLLYGAAEAFGVPLPGRGV